MSLDSGGVAVHIREMGKLDGKTAIVTGGGSGIGRAISEEFAAEGARVAIFDRDEAASGEAVSQIRSRGGSAEFFPCDVSGAESVATAVAAVEKEWGAPGILVNNAGIAHIGTATTTGEDDFDRILKVNVKGVYLCLFLARHPVRINI